MEVKNVGWMCLDARWRERNCVLALSSASRFSVKMNRFVDSRVDSLSLKTFEDSKSLSSESTLFFIESICFLPESKRFSVKMNRFVDSRVDSLSLKTFEDSKSLSSESTLFFIESICFLPKSKRLFLKLIRSWPESTRSVL
ncbi:hypothetical protein PIB30_063256 [Stylosanthes scabra]|uniref:Uncharacterized protein n=1 Tax=Stylosanthes scabra TaxID=79078 RepID=A0ABU6QLB9_9FABA|nr:hypothetical protein [Stylosanthes scabra]